MKRTLGAVVVSLLIMGSLTSAVAQERRLRLEGRVVWIAGQTMVLAVDDGPSVSIDLTQVAQSDYSALGHNEWVVVDAVMSRGSRRVIATSVQRTAESSPQAP